MFVPRTCAGACVCVCVRWQGWLVCDACYWSVIGVETLVEHHCLVVWMVYRRLISSTTEHSSKWVLAVLLGHVKLPRVVLGLIGNPGG